MEFREAKCPKCGGILQVPEDLEKLTCMYCGKEIFASDMAAVNQLNNNNFKDREDEILKLWESGEESAITKAEDILKKDPFNHTGNYIMALHSLPELITEHKDLLNCFKKNLYEKAMMEYVESSRPILVYVERACNGENADRSLILTECVKYFIHKIKEDMDIEFDKKLKKLTHDDYKMLLALFTIPMILESDLDISDEFADKIIEAWIDENPKNLIKKGNFEEINNGFSKKGFCYITTAVCESLDKPDNCYELTMFRRFRDSYLLTQEDGQELVEEYYRIAPFIVNNINALANKDDIYNGIWHSYLTGCLHAIESGDNVRCKDEYRRMVMELKRKYC